MNNAYKYMSQLQLLILNVGYAKHNADWNWKNISSPFMRIYYITDGCAEIIFDDNIQKLKKGYLYIIPPYTKHSYECHGKFYHYYLHIYEDRSNSSISSLDSWNYPLEIKAEGIDENLMKRLCNINPTMSLNQSNPLTYDNNATLINNIAKNKRRSISQIIESKGIVFQLFSRFLNRITPKADVNDDRLISCITYIRKNINENIKIEQLADICSLSKDHFIHIFKKEVGIPPLRYINQKKIEKAQLLLVTTDIPLKEISYALSIDDHSYFTRLFKKNVGVSPIIYRNIHSKIK